MNLKDATTAQLVDWHSKISQELYFRLGRISRPVEVRPPWEEPHTPDGNAFSRRLAEIGREKRAPLGEEEQPAETPEELIARAEKIMEARTNPRTAPQLLPGIRMTARTDPKMAQSFAAIPSRADGVPGLNGNGKGEGQIDF